MQHHRILSLLLLSFMLLSGCQGKGPEDPGKAEEKEEAPPVPVEVSQATRGQMLATYSGTAAIEAFAEADVIAKVGGEVEQILVEEGDVVKVGQVLAVLDGDRLRLELKQTEANMKKLEQEYQRNLDLHDRGLVSVGAFENLKYELDALKAGYERARLELSYVELRAPIEGVVAERFIKVGNTLNPNDKTFHVTTLKPLIIYLYAPEKEYRKIRPGQQSMVEVDALKGQAFPAVVSRVSPVIDSTSGTFKVTIEIDDPSGNLKPGMFGRVHIVHEKYENALLIPREAVIVDGDEEAVFLIEDNKASRRLLSTGITQNGMVQVLGGLTEEDRFVILGQAGLKDGTTVRVVNEPDAPEGEDTGSSITETESTESDSGDATTNE